MNDTRSLSDLGTIYCADGRAAQMSPIFRCVGPTMRLKIVTICPRSPTLLATIAQVRQTPRPLSFPHRRQSMLTPAGPEALRFYRHDSTVFQMSALDNRHAFTRTAVPQGTLSPRGPSLAAQFTLSCCAIHLVLLRNSPCLATQFTSSAPTAIHLVNYSPYARRQHPFATPGGPV